MPYTIKLSSGTKLVDIPDGAVDVASTSLSLIGRNTSGYGLFQNDNFVFLLENFASATPPDSPLVGQLWYDKNSQSLRVYGIDYFGSGNSWFKIPTVAIREHANTIGPDPFTAGNFNYSKDINSLLFHEGSQYAEIQTGLPRNPNTGLADYVSPIRPDWVKGKDTSTQEVRWYPVHIHRFGSGPSHSVFLVSDTTFDKPDLNIIDPVVNKVHANTDHPNRIFKGINLVSFDPQEPVMFNGVADQANYLLDTSDGPLGTDKFVRNDVTADQTLLSSLTVPSIVAGDDSQIGDLPVVGSTIYVANTNQSITLQPDGTGVVNIGETGTNINLIVSGALTSTGTITGNLTGNVAGNVTTTLHGYVNAESAKIDKLLTRDGLTTVIDTTKPIPEFTGKFIGDISGNISGVNITASGTATVTGNVTVTTGTLTATHGGTLTNFTINTPTISGANISGSTLTTASLTSPTLTGTPVAPTPIPSTNTTQVATTEFVHDIMPFGAIIMWSNSISMIPNGWALCDGTNGTPDLRNRFIIGAGSGSYLAPNSTGGTTTYTATTGTAGGHTHSVTVDGHALTTNEMPSHTHDVDDLYGLNDDQGPAVYDRNGTRIERYSSWGSDGDNDSGNPAWYYNRTFATGSGDAHSHTASTNTIGDHSHSVSLTGVRPPYYALCFIMKII